MGFGVIFLGYVTLLFFKIVPVGIIGAYLMYRGLSRLSVYGKEFERARNMSAVFFLYFAVYTLFWTGNTFGFFNILSDTRFILCDSLVYYAIFCVFQIMLCNALKGICITTEYDKGVKKAKLCMTATYVFAAASIIRIVLSFFSLAGYMALPMLLYELLLLIYTAAFVYSCYMMIATQEIIDEENRKMREYDEKYSMLKKKKEKSSYSVKKRH